MQRLRISSLVSRLERLQLRAGARVLLLGDAEALEGELIRRDWIAVRAASPERFGVDDHSCDAAVAVGFLERIEWDRWALQRIHATLRKDGELLLSVLHLLDLGTLGGWAFLAGRVVRESLRRLQRTTASPRFSGRRYSTSRLVSLTSSVRLAVEETWTERDEGLGALLPPRFAGRVGVRARKQPAVFGIHDAWPQPELHERAYETGNAGFLRAREEWLKRHPARRPQGIERLDPSAFAGKSVLVLAPHPDDEIIGCGGTLQRLIESGARVTCLQTTDGSAGAALERLPEVERRTVRIQEAERVASEIGFAEMVFWREDNRAFRFDRELVGRLRSLLERIRPVLILAPFVTENHPDHLTLDRALADAIASGPDLPQDSRVLSYEVWSLVPPNLICEVTDQMEKTAALLSLYEMAMRVDDYIRFCVDRNHYHAIKLGRSTGYFEAFHEVPASDYPALYATGGVPNA